MLFKSAVAVAALATMSQAQSSNQSICDKYTTALTMNNSAANQYTVLTLLVNTAVIGNYSSLANQSMKVPGILAQGTYGGKSVNLLPYFDGSLASTNVNGMASKVNFLDGGGATPLTQNKPANDTSSKQYFLLTHLYEFFGLLLGCSEVGMSGYPAYGGNPSMYEVHKFMVLTPEENGYFIEQVALAAASFGVTQSDLQAVGSALNSLFNYRCEPPTTIVPSAGNQTQSICTDQSCPLAPNSNCTNQPTIAAPAGASNSNASSSSGSSSSGAGSTGSAGGAGGAGGSMTASGSSPSGSSAPKSGASTLAVSAGLAAAVGFVGAVAVAFA